MKKEIINFLKKNKLSEPDVVNSLIITAFLKYKNLVVKNNLLLTQCIQYPVPDKDNLLNKLLNILSFYKNNFDFEELIQFFEFVVSPANRIINGAIYTPHLIRNFIINETILKKKKLLNTQVKVADIACGCGAFLIDIAKIIKKNTKLTYKEIYEKNLYGLDIETYAINRSKLLLSLLALAEGEDCDFSFNLFVGNTLSFNWNEEVNNFQGFDFILGNPPYVAARHLSDDTKYLLSKLKTCQTGNPDLYIPFFQIGIESLSNAGMLGFITMNSFFKSLNARALRKFFKEESLSLKIYDFGSEQVFRSRNTYTCICIIENRKNKVISYIKLKPNQLNNKKFMSIINYEDLDDYNGWNLQCHELIKKIELTGKPLGELYTTSHGLATLKNDIYIFTPIKTDDKYYYLQLNDRIFPIEKNICHEVINSNKLSRSIPLDELREKLIFPYSNESKPKLIDEIDFINNFPKAYAYLKANKDILSQRDKGKGKYKNWYAYGRSQGLEQVTHKMFFPKYSDITPHFIIHSDKRLYFYNGLAFLSKSAYELKIIKKILESKIFWFYIQTTSKPYSSNYYSLNGTYIKNFGVCDLTEEEKNFLLKEKDSNVLDSFFAKKYDINLKDLT